MRRELVRTLMSLVALVVTLLVAPSAFAGVNRAPVCDPRGAVGFAPHPQIQDTEQSLDVAEADDACAPSQEAARHADRDEGRSGAQRAGGQEPTLHAASALVARAPRSRLPAPPAARPEPRPAFALALERPPRA